MLLALCCQFVFKFVLVNLLSVVLRSINHFQARSYSRGRRLLTRSCPSVCPHVSGLVPLDGFQWNVILRTFKKICHEIPNLVKIGQKHRALYMKYYVRFIVAGDICHKVIIVQHSMFLNHWQLHVAQQHTECTCVFPRQQRLRERATMLRHTYTDYLVVCGLMCCQVLYKWFSYIFIARYANCINAVDTHQQSVWNLGCSVSR
jgi:hypothetical protein